jgi:sulfite reductase (NADPH) flavoprotein alpha-component
VVEYLVLQHYSPTNEPDAGDCFGDKEQDNIHFQQDSSNDSDMANGHALEDQEPQDAHKPFVYTSSTLLFGQNIDISAIGQSQEYLTALTLIQHVVYTLSDKIFAYSPETFDLDVALKHWRQSQEKNAFGYTGSSGVRDKRWARCYCAGYVFSRDFDLSKRYIPQSIVVSSYTLA